MKVIAYYRVSTQKQGNSGLGLEAQRQAVTDYLSKISSTLIEEFQEIESGTKDDRPQLQKALRKCRLTGATLLIAKLDRLSRNRRFLMELADSSIEFVCCDMPEANNFTVGLLACLADYERQLISERTKAALKAAKARGVKLGNPNLLRVRNQDTTAARNAHLSVSQRRREEIAQVIEEMEQEAGCSLSSRSLAERLNDAGYTTRRGGQWSHVGVLRVRAATQTTKSR